MVGGQRGDVILCGNSLQRMRNVPVRSFTSWFCKLKHLGLHIYLICIIVRSVATNYPRQGETALTFYKVVLREEEVQEKVT